MSNNNLIGFAKHESKTKEFNDTIVRKTWYYQKKFHFEVSTDKGHEFWNNEADTFCHA